jgi:ribosomal protein RSM22 (predicted rRNA methylase)
LTYTDDIAVYRELGDAVKRATGVSVYPDPPKIKEWTGLIKELSDNFNKGGCGTGRSPYREGQGNVLDAYCLYFMPCNTVRMMGLLNSVYKENTGAMDEVLNKDKVVLWDIGCGPASATLAFCMRFPETAKRTAFVLADHNREMLARAEKVLAGCCGVSAENISAQIHCLGSDTGILQKRFGPPDIIITANVLAEIQTPDVGNYIKTGAKFLFMMEPALKKASRKLLSVRDGILNFNNAAAYRVIYPCTIQEGCPALKEKDNWCHMSVKWQRPEWIRLFDRHLSFDKSELDYTAAVFTTGIVPVEPAAYRVVSDISKKKWGRQLYACGNEGLIKRIGVKAGRGDKIYL